MPIDQIFMMIIPGLMMQLPILLVLLAGCVVAIIHLVQKKNRKPAVLALIAFILFLKVHLLSPVLSSLPYLMSVQYNMGPQQIGAVTMVVNIGFNGIATVGWVLIVIAIFIARKPSAAPEKP